MCLLLPADGALFTGDTVLGRGTTVIAGDGNLGDYLRTLDQLRDLAGAREVGLLLPGHGPMLTDPLGTLDYYLSHRQERLDQVRSALAAGAKTPAEIVAMIYTDVDPSGLAGRGVVGPRPARLPRPTPKAGHDRGQFRPYSTALSGESRLAMPSCSGGARSRAARAPAGVLRAC